MSNDDDLNKNQVAGRVDQATGEVKETVGEATDDKELVREGLNEQLSGKAEENLGDKKAETSDHRGERQKKWQWPEVANETT